MKPGIRTKSCSVIAAIGVAINEEVLVGGILLRGFMK